MKMKGNSQRGWVFIDSLVGLVVLSIALLALCFAFRQGVIGTADADNHTAAAYFAKERLTELRQYDGSGRARNSAEWTAWINDNNNTRKIFTRRTEFLTDTEIPNDLKNNTDIIPVRVTVSWHEQTGDKSISMISYYYR